MLNNDNLFTEQDLSTHQITPCKCFGVKQTIGRGSFAFRVNVILRSVSNVPEFNNDDLKSHLALRQQTDTRSHRLQLLVMHLNLFLK